MTIECTRFDLDKFLEIIGEAEYAIELLEELNYPRPCDPQKLTAQYALVKCANTKLCKELTNIMTALNVQHLDLDIAVPWTIVVPFILPKTIKSMSFTDINGRGDSLELVTEFLQLNKHLTSLSFSKLKMRSPKSLENFKAALIAMPILTQLSFDASFLDLK